MTISFPDDDSFRINSHKNGSISRDDISTPLSGYIAIFPDSQPKPTDRAKLVPEDMRSLLLSVIKRCCAISRGKVANETEYFRCHCVHVTS